MISQSRSRLARAQVAALDCYGGGISAGLAPDVRMRQVSAHSCQACVHARSAVPVTLCSHASRLHAISLASNVLVTELHVPAVGQSVVDGRVVGRE